MTTQAGEGAGRRLGGERGNGLRHPHVKRLFPSLAAHAGDGIRVASHALPSAKRAQTAQPSAIAAFIPVIPSPYGDDYQRESLLTSFIGEAA